MSTSPYTHPSMPGTKPMVFDLSAALEDAEGRAYVDAINNPNNPRLVGHNRLQADGSAAVVGSFAETLGETPV